jgi:hypothetical protein
MSPQTGIAVVAAIAAFVLAVLFYKSHRLWFVGCVGVFLVAVVAGIYFQNEMDYEEHGNDQIFAGILQPGVEYPLKPAKCGEMLRQDVAILSLGKRSGALLTDNPDSMHVFEMTGGSNLTIRRDWGMMFLSGALADAEGHPVVIFKDNVFFIDSNRVLRDRVPNDHELFVYDRMNRLLLHVDFRNPLNIYLVGTFSAPKHYPLTIMDDSMRIGGAIAGDQCFWDVTTGWDIK